MLQSEWNPLTYGQGRASAPGPRLLVRPVAPVLVGIAGTLELLIAFVFAVEI